MKRTDFSFDLPQELIAQTPIPQRDHSRLLSLDKNTGEIQHGYFYELPSMLRPGDCLIVNDSRVLPARLLGQRSGVIGSALSVPANVFAKERSYVLVTEN